MTQMTHSSAPLVSIVIPCWNAEHQIGKAISSALHQTYAHREVIVIDDGSTDGSLDVIRSFGGRIRWEASERQGAGAARNRGIRLSKGEVLQFLDADDWLHAEKLARQIAVLASSGASSAFCDLSIVSVDQPAGAVRYVAHEVNADPVCVALGSNAGTNSGLHRQDVVARIGGFDESLPCAQDRDFHLRLAIESDAVAVVPEALVTAVRRPHSVSSDLLKVYVQYERILRRASALLDERRGWTEERAVAMARLAARAARVLGRNGDGTSAARLWEVALGFHKRGVAGIYGPKLRPLVRVFGAQRVERILGVLRPGRGQSRTPGGAGSQ